MSLLSVCRFRPQGYFSRPAKGGFAGKRPIVASAHDDSPEPEERHEGESIGAQKSDPGAKGSSTTPFETDLSRDRAGARILILDDELSVRRVCSYALRASGWQPEGEGSARSALERIRGGEKYDVVVLDYAMPDMNGLEFLEALRELPESFRPAVLMASAHADGAVAKAAMRLGVWDFLPKPLMPDDIRRRTRRLLDRPASAARGEKVAGALLHAGQCRWSVALKLLEGVSPSPAPLLRGLFHEMNGDEAAAQREYARAYWSSGWSDRDADVWSELSLRLDIDD